MLEALVSIREIVPGYEYKFSRALNQVIDLSYPIAIIQSLRYRDCHAVGLLLNAFLSEEKRRYQQAEG